MKGRVIGGPGKVAEVDGGYFGGYMKPTNFKQNRRDRRLTHNQNGKRQVVVVVRERGGNSLPAVFTTEAQALSFIRARVAQGTTLNADEAGSWNNLHGRCEMLRINHQEAYSDGMACTNNAESFFSRMRRGEIRHHHHVAGPYLIRFAQEAALREDNRRMANGEQVQHSRDEGTPFRGLLRILAATTERLDVSTPAITSQIYQDFFQISFSAIVRNRKIESELRAPC